MGFSQDLEIIQDLLQDIKIEEVEEIFQEVIIKLSEFLGFDPVFKNISVFFSSSNNSVNHNISPFDIGVRRFIENNVLSIEISPDYNEFLPFILLREAYYSLLPKKNITVEVAINSFVEKNLEQCHNIKKWRETIRDYLIHDSDISAILSTFEKLHSEIIDPVSIFFKCVRANITIIQKDLDDLVKQLQEESLLEQYGLLFNEEILETLRVLINIFYKVKNYSALLDYKEYFKEFKAKNIIQTELSLRKFTESMKLIRNSVISPSYQLDWTTIGQNVFQFYIRFHPQIALAQVYEFLGNLPFIIGPKLFFSGKCLELLGFLLAPAEYNKDLKSLFRIMKNRNYLLQAYLFDSRSFINSVNFNFFKPYNRRRAIIDCSHKKYDSNYEINFNIKNSYKVSNVMLDYLDFLIFDRIRFFSTNSIGFARRANTLIELKNARLEEIIYQKNLNSDFIKYVNKIFSNSSAQDNFIRILKDYRSYGFFYIKRILEDLVTILEYIEPYSKNSKIRNVSHFMKDIREKGITQLLEVNVLLKNEAIKSQLIKTILPLYFTSKDKFYLKLEEFRLFHDLLEVSFELKIFDLNDIKRIIENPSEAESIHLRKEKKLAEVYRALEPKEISTKQVEGRIGKYIDSIPQIIEPFLFNTLPFPSMIMSHYFLLLKSSKESMEAINTFRKFLPIHFYYVAINIFTKVKHYLVFFKIPTLYYKEEYRLLSILHNIFKEDVIIARRNYSSGFNDVFSAKSFYDFENSKYFYTKSLFEQTRLSILKLLGDSLEPISDSDKIPFHQFISKDNDLNKLAQEIINREQRLNNDFTLKHVKNLIVFNSDIPIILKDISIYTRVKQEYFFTNYIKSIKFIPAFQQFGLDQYFLYICPINISEIDFKLLFLNSFQKVMYPASLDTPLPFLIKYIMPKQKPNKKYLKWLIRSKKGVREYCLFRVKKVHSLLHVDFGFDESGWEYDVDKFKRHIDNILFNSDYIFQASKSRVFDMSNETPITKYPPNSLEFKALLDIYSKGPLDLKTYYNPKYKMKVKNILSLLEKRLIFPYIAVKNLDFRDKFSIILPNIKKEHITKLVQIFSYFNYGFIYEIEGDFYITGSSEEIRFENGLMIKLYFPETTIHYFIEKFSLLFQYLEIDYFIFLFNYVNGIEFLKSVHGGLKFLDSYNPLKNLIWNEKEKKWMNHKLFTEKFEKIYPPLNYNYIYDPKKKYY